MSRRLAQILESRIIVAMTSMYSRAAWELVRAVRGKRSQVALSRRLGYRGNPVTDWEAGRSQPDTIELLHAARLARLPVNDAFERLQSGALPRTSDGSIDLPRWLDSFRGSSSIAALAERMDRSRHCVRRWLSGESCIKVADFLELLDTVTGRAHDWVAELVPIERVPALLEQHTRASRAQSLALELPWTEAILRVLETGTYRSDPRASDCADSGLAGDSTGQRRDGAGAPPGSGRARARAGALRRDARAQH